MPNAIDCPGNVNGRWVVGTNICPAFLNMLMDQSTEVMTEAQTADNNDKVDLKNAILALIAAKSPVPTWLSSQVSVLVNGTASSWTAVDCSSAVPAGATAAILNATIFNPHGIPTELHVRQDSSKAADLVIDAGVTQYYNYNFDFKVEVIVPLSSNKAFDYKLVGSGSKFSVTVVGYM